MDRSLFIKSVCMFVENHIRGKLDMQDMVLAIGYSQPHIRAVFKQEMQVPLSRFILTRRLSHAAFDMIHTEKNLLAIAEEYGFKQYDAFTRAFKRKTGLLPKEFRKRRAGAGRRLIAVGIYVPEIIGLPWQPELKTEVLMNELSIESSCLLMGVPKVEYKWEECTPFPSCLKACLNYMGQDISYTYLMAASGAAFRLRWSKAYWDCGNVDISYIYPDATEAFRRSFEAAGRSFQILKREGSSKQDFIEFIKKEIQEGRPVIALGIVGPPEACILTGYQDDGNTLLGWNFFQNRPEYNKGVSFHESGYFISSEWWENENTTMLMSVGEAQGVLHSDSKILKNALTVMESKTIRLTGNGEDNEVACGQEAYSLWAQWTGDDSRFAENMTLPLLNERFMCQIDAQTMVGEGRWYASEYIKTVSKSHPEIKGLCENAAGKLVTAGLCASKSMYEALGRQESEEETLRHYALPETRHALARLIREAAAQEKEAIQLISRIAADMTEE